MDNKMVVEQMDNTEQRKETSERPGAWNAFLSKYADLGAVIAAELMIGFWCDVGVFLAIGVANGLNYCIGALREVAANEISTTKMDYNIAATEAKSQFNPTKK